MATSSGSAIYWVLLRVKMMVTQTFYQVAHQVCSIRRNKS